MNDLREVKVAMELAPCIAVIGPANAGKTTLLHLLDERLQKRLRCVLVIKGNPDHTGRYQFHAPDLREALKAHVKGKWGDSTIAHIRESIDCGRQNLELALLDFGGMHNPLNDQMLSHCSHYILVTRLDGAAGDSWVEVAARNGLEQVAWLRSAGQGDSIEPEIALSSDGLTGTFRWDVQPGDPANDAVLERLTEQLVALRRDPDLIPYVDLHASQRWEESHLADVHGRAAKIREMARRTGVVTLGGAAPIWAYLGALRCALNANRNARVFFFDPQQPERLVEIPEDRTDGPFPEAVLEVRWSVQPDFAQLEFHMLREDRFLPPRAAQDLEHAPTFGEPPKPDVCLWGKGPTWLYGAYARWLIAAGVERLSTYDAGMKKAITVWP